MLDATELQLLVNALRTVVPHRYQQTKDAQVQEFGQDVQGDLQINMLVANAQPDGIGEKREDHSHCKGATWEKTLEYVESS